MEIHICHVFFFTAQCGAELRVSNQKAICRIGSTSRWIRRQSDECWWYALLLSDLELVPWRNRNWSNSRESSMEVLTFRKGMTNGLRGKLVASWSFEWKSSMVRVEFWSKAEELLVYCGVNQDYYSCPRFIEVFFWFRSQLTTSPSTRLRTLSPISGDMSLPNCCSVVRKRFNLQSCRAPQAGGSCWLEREAVEDMAGPLLKPLGVDGAPLSDVGEWLLPFSTVERRNGGTWFKVSCFVEVWGGTDRFEGVVMPDVSKYNHI